MKTSLITGASSGIGYKMAKLFTSHGHNLVLVARNYDRLKEISKELAIGKSIQIQTLVADLSQTDSANKLYRQLMEKSIHVNYLVNNAGFYIKGSFADSSWEKEEELIQIQCIQHTHLTKLLLPEMIKSGDGGILNVCSTGSFIPGPFNAIYCAAKSFVLSFSEALAEEVKGTGVHVTALCPGGTKTNLQDFNNRKMGFMEASSVAKAGYHGFFKGKRLVIPGIGNKLQVFLARILPKRMVIKMASAFMKKQIEKP